MSDLVLADKAQSVADKFSANGPFDDKAHLV